MHDIFLSYSREDQSKARQFADALEGEGLKVWWDVTLRLGEAYDEVIEQALRDASAVIVLWSTRSVASRWVRAEATLADRNKSLVPVMIETCERPIMFELTQTAELSHWRGDRSDRAWRAFVAEVLETAQAKRAATAREPLAAAPAPLPPAGVHGEAPSIAVLPFANRSGLAEDDVFSVGMVEDVISALSQGVNVRVIASSATARFRSGAIHDLAAMARSLGVRYVLEGNLRRSGQSLRVTSQLVDAAYGTILWTQRFDRPLSELSTLQEALVLEVAANLNVQVSRLEMERALRKPAQMTAWEAVTRASSAYRQFTGTSILDSVEEAKRAIAIAPDYGLAHAMLAMAEAVLYSNFTPDDPAEIRRIRKGIDTALGLDRDNALVLATVAHAFNFLGLPADALRHAERAAHQSPGAATAHGVWGGACVLLNRSDEAIGHFDDEIRASPGAPTHYASYAWRANAHIRAGRWSDAMAALDRALDQNPHFAGALVYKAILSDRDGLADEARTWFARTREADPSTPLDLAELRLRRFFAGAPQIEEIAARFKKLWLATD